MTDNEFTPEIGNARQPGSTQLKVGDTLVVNATDKRGVITKTICITRTDRPYAYDLRDAYNEALPAALVDRGVRYVVRSGEVKLEDDPNWTEAHTKRLRQMTEAQREDWLSHYRKYNPQPKD